MLILKTVKRQTLILISLSLPGNILFPYGRNFHSRAKARNNSKSLKCLLFSSGVLSCVHSNINIFTFVSTADSKDKLSCTESLLHQLTPTHSLRGVQLPRTIPGASFNLTFPWCQHTIYTVSQVHYLLTDPWVGASRDLMNHLIKTFIKLIIFLGIFISLCLFNLNFFLNVSGEKDETL